MEHYIETPAQSYHELPIGSIRMSPAHLSSWHVIDPISTSNSERDVFSRPFDKGKITTSVKDLGEIYDSRFVHKCRFTRLKSYRAGEVDDAVGEPFCGGKVAAFRSGEHRQTVHQLPDRTGHHPVVIGLGQELDLCFVIR